VNDYHGSTISQLETFDHQFPQAENVAIIGGLILTTDERGFSKGGVPRRPNFVPADFGV
jgi:hypothetical protein